MKFGNYGNPSPTPRTATISAQIKMIPLYM